MSEYKLLQSSYVQFSEKGKDIPYETLVQINAPSKVAITLGHTPSVGKFHSRLRSERKIRCDNKICKVLKKKGSRATAVTEKCCSPDRMKSVYRRSTLFTDWSYCAAVVEIRLCGHKCGTYMGKGSWEDRKDGTCREKRKGRKLAVKNEG